MLADDEYYDEELDEEEALLYQQMMANGQDPAMLSAQNLINEGFEIMEEELDEDYEPTNEELLEYAQCLGMDPVQDKELLYIAKEGLKAPLPGPWKPCKSPKGSIYYFNFESQVLQQEHPCDDYYRNYYQREKINQQRKKEENQIKKQMKQQQKQQMQSSGGQQQLNQMMMNVSALDISTSAIQEKVMLETELLQEEYEEKQIQYERKKREGLKELEQEKQKQIKVIEEKAKKEIQEIKEKLQKETQRNKYELESQKKVKLQIEKEQVIRETREKERRKLDRNQQELRSRFERERNQIKEQEERRYKLEEQNLKEKYRNKLEIEKEKIKDETEMIIEECKNIDGVLAKYRREMLEEKIESDKFNLDEEYRLKVNQLKTENLTKSDKEKESILIKYKEKLQTEDQKEKKKLKQEQARLEEMKKDIKESHNQKLKDEMKKYDKQTGEKLKELKSQLNEDIDQAKLDIKKAVQKQFDIKCENIGKEIQREKERAKEKQEKYEEKQKQSIQQKQREIEQELEDELQKEKQQYLKDQNEKSESYQSIIDEIQQIRIKKRDLEYKQTKLEKELKQCLQKNEDLLLIKKAKEREINNDQSILQKDDYTYELESELRTKNDELASLKSMLREKQLQKEQQADNKYESSNEYQRISREIDQIKFLLVDIKGQQLDPKIKYWQGDINQKKPLIKLDYTLSEIRALIELDLPKVLEKKEKYENDRILLKQLINNLEKNRTKLRKEFFESNDISQERKISISSIKEKLDSQASNLAQEESQLKDKCDYYRRKEEKLRQMQSKLKMHDKEQESDRKEFFLSDLQIDYDKYLKLYQKDLEFKGKDQRKKNQNNSLKADEYVFQSRWADYLIEEADQDLKPIIGLDPERQLFKPTYLYKKYEMSNANFKNKIGLNHIYEYQYEKMKQSKTLLRDFLNNQQKWLSDLKSDISSTKINFYPQKMSHYY